MGGREGAGKKEGKIRYLFAALFQSPLVGGKILHYTDA